MKLRIWSSGPTMYETHVALDGVELTEVVELNLHIGKDAINQATITFVAGAIDVDAETVAKLHAVLEEQPVSR